MRNFSIIVGTNQEQYKKCGSYHNFMSLGKWKEFLCESNATGVSLTITEKGKGRILNMCEVFVFGTGMVEFKHISAINTGGKYTYIHAYIHTCIYRYTHACMHSYVHKYIMYANRRR